MLACKSVDKDKSCNHQGFHELSEAVSYLKYSGIKNIMVHSDKGSEPLDKYVTGKNRIIRLQKQTERNTSVYKQWKSPSVNNRSTTIIETIIVSGV